MELTEHLNIADYFLDARIRAGEGDRVALRTPSGQWTYSQIHDLAERFATVIRRRGVKQEQRVILSLLDGPLFVGAFFGILKAGAVVVMVNPYLATEAFSDICQHARAPLAIIEAHNESAQAVNGAWPESWLRLGDEADDEALSEALPNGTCATHRDDAAIWLFSGGTTGRPKAVVQSHASFVYTTRSYAHQIIEYGPDDVVLSVPKLYFGYATGANLLFPFSVGATACLFPGRCTVEALFEMIDKFKPTILVNVPTMVNHMVSFEGVTGGGSTPDLSSLRLATSAGEALPPSLHARWRDRFGVPLVDGLGTAEMWHIFLSNRPGDVTPGTLGRPVPGFEVQLCDPEGRPVPQGEVGLMRVKGGARANGYWQNAEQDRAAFQGPWYVSQDMMRQNPDGTFTYCGRGDDMLKVSGKWMSPQEVEDHLLQHPMVKEAAVVGITDDAGLVKPWAFVIATDGVPAQVAEATSRLTDHLRAQLESYKVPREIRFVEDFPRTHLGKVARGRLKAPLPEG